LPSLDEASPKEKLAWEKELVGIYLSEHPLTRVMADLHDTVTVMCGEITEDMANQKVIVAGMVTYVRRLTTKKGDPMAFAGLEDLQGATEVVIFPRIWKQAESICQPDKILVVRGKVDGSGKQPKILAESITDQYSVAGPADEASVPRPAASAPAPRLKPVRISKEPEPTWDLEPDVPPPPPDDGWPVDARAVKPVAAVNTDRRPLTPAKAGDRRPPTPAQAGDRQQPTTDRRPTANDSQPPTIDRRLRLKPETADHSSLPTAHAPLTTDHSPLVTDHSPLTTLTRPRRLTITFVRSGDQTRDMSLLSQAHQLLTSHAGGDRFVFRLTGGGNGPIEMDFPNHNTHYSPELVGALEKMLGSGSVRVEMQG